MKILLAEDQSDQADYLRTAFQEAGYGIDWVKTGRDALILCQDHQYDVIISDWMMPEMDGIQFIKALRVQDILTPVIILSALDSIDDRVQGLRSGGDDYLVKPFAFRELLARVDLLYQRHQQAAKPSPALTTDLVQLDNLILDQAQRQVSRGGKNIEISHKEFMILDYFMGHIDQIVTRRMIIDYVWGTGLDPQPNVVDSHISRLRKKIDCPDQRPLFHTIRGVGYKFGQSQ